MLDRGSRLWSTLTLDQRARLLDRLHDTVAAAAEEWADTAADAKGLGPQHPLRGEEWLTGPYATLVALEAYARTLRTLAAGGSPLDGVRLEDAPGGRVRARVFPATALDRIVLSGFTGEVWLRPGTGRAHARAAAGLAQRRPTESGGVGLVLGAGNITAIPVLDVLYELLSANRVSVLKLNPTQDALVPVFARALAPLIEPGFLRIVTGDGAVGADLVARPEFSHVHITGSARTFDAIVWGTEHPRPAEPQLRVPITAELGGVAPVILVPGRWTAADLRFQAEHIATMRLQNGGHNCIAGQVVIVSADWPQRGAFLSELRRAYAAAPARPVWYPGAAATLARVREATPDATWIGDGTRAVVTVPADAATAAPVESTEYFAPVLGVLALPGEGQAFLDAAVAHANERLTGSLGANVLIDPDTERALGDGFERAIADLHYGGIAINAWTGVSFTIPTLSWGAYPGGTLADVGSGLGVVHNALLLDDVERSVLRGPFRPFPRSLGRRERFSILPKPPWFVSSRTGAAVSEGLTRYYAGRRIPTLVATLTRALGA